MTLIAIYVTGVFFTALIVMIFNGGWKGLLKGWLTVILWPVILSFLLISAIIIAFCNSLPDWNK